MGFELRNSFWFADQGEITFGLEYTLVLKRNTRDAIIRGKRVDVVKPVMKEIRWYIPYNVPSMENQQIVMLLFLDKNQQKCFI